jgi:hypothetical protein
LQSRARADHVAEKGHDAAESLSIQRFTPGSPTAEEKGTGAVRRVPGGGLPIGSGVAEGPCCHLVKDRMEQTGMRWTVEGARAMLHVRTLYLNDQWEEFHEHRVDREQARLYTRPAA